MKSCTLGVIRSLHPRVVPSGTTHHNLGITMKKLVILALLSLGAVGAFAQDVKHHHHHHHHHHAHKAPMQK